MSRAVRPAALFALDVSRDLTPRLSNGDMVETPVSHEAKQSPRGAAARGLTPDLTPGLSDTATSADKR